VTIAEVFGQIDKSGGKSGKKFTVEGNGSVVEYLPLLDEKHVVKAEFIYKDEPVFEDEPSSEDIFEHSPVLGKEVWNYS
jgi:hypothetical protein